MGNKPPMNFKNFHLPNVEFQTQENNSFKSVTRSQKNQIDPDIHLKYKFDTYSLKTQNILKQDDKYSIGPIKSIKILTYNVWFQQHNIKNRINAILKIINEADADIICLQQVTNDFIQALWKNSKQLCVKGQLFLPAVPMFWYDTLILTKFPMIFYRIPFLSSMSRSLLMGTFQIINEKNEIINCSINCVHLQSLNNEKLRIDQLEMIEKINAKIDMVFVAGDMNFSDNWKEDLIIQKEYIDLWKVPKQNKDESWTMPATMRFPQWRPDHILLKCNQIGNQKLRNSKDFDVKIERIGVFTVPPFESQSVLKIIQDQIVRTPSDHMGLLLNIKF